LSLASGSPHDPANSDEPTDLRWYMDVLDRTGMFTHAYIIRELDLCAATIVQYTVDVGRNL
jgi:hypothetical protein